jgi:hypothetical protein
MVGPLVASTVFSAGLVSSLAACGAPVSAARAEAPTDPIDSLPTGPLVLLPSKRPSTETSAGPETSYFVTFSDSAHAEHTLIVRFTSYPIVVTEVSLDGMNTRRGASWARLGRRLFAAYGESNNVTILLRCFGGDAEERC